MLNIFIKICLNISLIIVFSFLPYFYYIIKSIIWNSSYSSRSVMNNLFKCFSEIKFFFIYESSFLPSTP